MLRTFRPYRVLRVALSILRVMPRYLVLGLRERRSSLAASQESWDRVHEFAAEEIRRLALALAGAFTKGAQIGGARADVLPKPYIDKLSQFHDAVPPRPFELLRPIVERDLGRSCEVLFARIEPEAIAAASLAQVHRATLHDGREVVLKIQYPEIRRLIPLDLATLRRAAWVISRLQSYLDISMLVNEVTRFIELELDFEREVESTDRVRVVLAANPEVVVPEAVHALCAENVIVLEYLDGIQVTRARELVAAGHKLPEIARKIGRLYGSMIFESGYFHGDPHPGNLLILADGRIALLDFGLCKELPDGFARGVAQMMIGAIIGDAAFALEAALALGFEADAISADNLRALMLMAIGDSDGDESLLDVLGASRIRKIPEDFALVIRTLVLLNGLSDRLVPGRRLIQGELIQHLAAGAAEKELTSR